MGPLVPTIISSEFDLVIALILGFGFGFVLEQAGFSRSNKLVGLFYGYDFVVLRVFFTAGVTALIGVLFLNYMGLLDLNLIYINPTFLTSALIGGAIMGAGFIVGGFCPGTSISAAAIGKIDAIIFIIGSMVGIYLFMEAYPFLKGLYTDRAMGSPLINDVLGMSRTGFAFLMTLIAIIAFIGVTLIENKVNNRELTFNNFWRSRWGFIAFIPFLFLALVAFTPDKDERLRRKLNDPDLLKECHLRTINVDKFAFDLVHNHYTINVIDVRPPQEFKDFHLPLAINIPLDSMSNMEYRTYFRQNFKKNVFYSSDSLTSGRACKFSESLGDSDNYVLCCPPNRFRQNFYYPEEPPEGSAKELVDLYNFRVQTGKQLKDLEKVLGRFNKPVIKRVRRATGGCS